MVDTNLTAEADELVGQLDKIRTVLANIEERKESVRPAVYAKVRREYMTKLEGLRDRVQPLLDRIRGDLQGLADSEATLTEDKERIDLDLEELTFRLEVGDIESGEHDQRRGDLDAKLAEINGRLSDIGSQVTELNALASRLQIGDLLGDADTPSDGGSDASPEETGDDDLPDEEDEVDPKESGERRWDLGEELVGAVEEVEPEPVAEAEPVDVAVEEEAEEAGEIPAAEAEQSDEWEKEFFGDEGRPEPADKGETEEQAFGRFRILQGVNAGKVYMLTEQEIKVGRDLDNNIQILDPKISRHHFVVERKKRAYLLRDQESANGTYVNNRRVDEIGLSDGDEVRIGGTIIQFELPK